MNRFPVLSAEDVERAIKLGRKIPNAASQQLRLRLGWSPDFNFCIKAEGSKGTYSLYFESDICTKIGHITCYQPLQFFGYSYDYIAATMRADGYIFERYELLRGTDFVTWDATPPAGINFTE